jgi:hypothetical protein
LVVRLRRFKGRVSATTSQSHGVVKRPKKVKEAAGCIRAISSPG